MKLKYSNTMSEEIFIIIIVQWNVYACYRFEESAEIFRFPHRK